MPGFLASVDTSISVPTALIHLYYICFLVGFCLSATVFCLLYYIFPPSEVMDFIDSNSAKSLMADYQDRWDGEVSNTIDGVDKNARIADREVNVA